MAKSYIGVSETARSVPKMYIGIGNVARKVKKGYIGVGNVARLFYKEAQNIPVKVGTVSLSRNNQYINITGLDFTPAYVFCLSPLLDVSGMYPIGMISNVPTPAGTDKGDIFSDWLIRTRDIGVNSFSAGTLQLNAKGSAFSNHQFYKGDYVYTVVGEGDGENVMFGTLSLASIANSISIDIGANSVVDFKLCFDSSFYPNDYDFKCTYAYHNNTVYYTEYDDEYASYGPRKSATQAYTINDGILTANAKSGYVFPKGTYHYCIVKG